MKAFVKKVINGNPGIAIDQYVSRKYKTLDGLIKATRSKLNSNEAALVEVYYDWDKRYGRPDLSFTISK